MAHLTGATVAGTAWVAAAIWIRRPEIVEWLTPILVGLLLSIPISVFSSSVSVGTLARRWGLFLTPEETAPPDVLRELHLALHRRQAQDHAPARPVDAFVQAVVDPIANAHHVWQATFRARDGASSAAHLVEKAVRGGPMSLGAEERAAILEDPDSLASLHVAVWSEPAALTHRWRLSG